MMSGKRELVDPSKPVVFTPALEIKLWDSPASIIHEKLLTQHQKMQSDLKMTLINSRPFVPSFAEYMDPYTL